MLKRRNIARNDVDGHCCQ